MLKNRKRITVLELENEILRHKMAELEKKFDELYQTFNFLKENTETRRMEDNIARKKRWLNGYPDEKVEV